MPSAQTSSHVTPTLTDRSAQQNSTKTYSMSYSLANSLNERDISPDKQQNGLNQFLAPANPVRFNSITTETMSESMRSATEAIYTSAMSMTGVSANQAIMAQSSGSVFGGVDLSALNIVDKIKNLSISSVGLASIASILPLKRRSPHNSRNATPRLSRKIYNTDQVGLNVVKVLRTDAESASTVSSEISASNESLSSISTLSVSSGQSEVAVSASASTTGGLNDILSLSDKPRRIKSLNSKTTAVKKPETNMGSVKSSVSSKPSGAARKGATPTLVTAPSSRKPFSERPLNTNSRSGLNSILGLSASAKRVDKPAKTAYTCSTCTAGSAAVRVANTSTVSSLSAGSRLSPSVATKLPERNKGSLTDCLKSTS